MNNDTNHAEANNCRLCGGETGVVFSKKIMGKYDVNYYKCVQCRSLQTEKPYWLDEAYEKNNLSNTDTGAAQRNLYNLTASFMVSKIIKAKNIIDIGGGDGLLCRLLRDYKLNCYVKDKYAAPAYAQGFTEENFKTPDLILGFEVLEHYPNPMVELEELFDYQPHALLVSTDIYTNQGTDWWYLSAESGQHVFFYSRHAMEIIAKKYEYELIMSGGYTLFIKKITSLQKILIKILLRSRVLRLLKSVVFLLPTPGLWQDHLLQVEKSKQDQQQA